jgi:monofunctional biosynthetic peptidoglycan transglycosylase
LTFLFKSFSAILLLCLSATILWVIILKFHNPSNPSHRVKKIIQSENWIKYDEIPLIFKTSLIAAEDSSFMSHSGFNFDAILAAYNYNNIHGTKIGGSTISQQTAKNVFLWGERSWLRKGLEVYFTLLIECLWGKKRILEVYLNIAQTGSDIYGIESACYQYYNKSAISVSDMQAAIIIGTLPSPVEYNKEEYTLYRILRGRYILSSAKGIEESQF